MDYLFMVVWEEQSKELSYHKILINNGMETIYSMEGFRLSKVKIKYSK